MIKNDINIDSSFLIEYREEINNIFRIYFEDINPFIVQFEILKNEFPIEVQNEIRAIYGHLVRASIAKNENEVVRNIEKMRSHTKRALFDCFKFSCIIISDEYTNFFIRYKGVDLTYINKGDFLRDIQQKYRDASNQIKKAKQLELSNASEDQLVSEYQYAYELFADIDKKLREAEKDASYLKHKATKKDIISVISLMVGVIGAVVGLLGWLC